MTTTTATEATPEYKPITREDIDRLAAEFGWDAERAAEYWAKIEAAQLRNDRIRAAGLQVFSHRALVRLSNVRMYAGRLQDATCHYHRQVRVSGNTYRVKDQLKAAGYRWEPGDKVWARKIADGQSIADAIEAARDEIDRILG